MAPPPTCSSTGNKTVNPPESSYNPPSTAPILAPSRDLISKTFLLKSFLLKSFWALIFQPFEREVGTVVRGNKFQQWSLTRIYLPLGKEASSRLLLSLLPKQTLFLPSLSPQSSPVSTKSENSIVGGAFRSWNDFNHNQNLQTIYPWQMVDKLSLWINKCPTNNGLSCGGGIGSKAFSCLTHPTCQSHKTTTLWHLLLKSEHKCSGLLFYEFVVCLVAPGSRLFCFRIRSLPTVPRWSNPI